jgi:membrane-bound lytic murein transglycosylase D
VRRGESLISIVRKLHCSSVQEVAEMNGLKHHRIRAGQVLKLPACH